ncbi:MAG: hypothetical protein WBO04_10825 [Steroidobacteraceae bacterium]
MRSNASETIRSLALLVIAAFPTVALIASFPSHAEAQEATMPAAASLAADEDGAIVSDADVKRERRCERTRRIGKVTQTRCD